MPTAETLPRLAWQIQPAKDARKRLTQARYPGSLPSATAGVVGVLYAYGSGSGGAEIVAWLQPAGDKSLRRLKRETETINRFDHWLERQWPIDVWTLVTAWTFYSNWLMHDGHPNWQASLGRKFPDDPFLDQLLAASGGWLLWRYQVKALMQAAAGWDRADGLAQEWERKRDFLKRHRFVLPNGTQLKMALKDRSYRIANQRAILFPEPDIPEAARIHAIYTEARRNERNRRNENPDR